MSDRQGCPEDRHPKRLKNRLGQISVLVVFSIIPMFTLLAFTINIGMMVNAKIALQNAADMAAYAGAANQARLMTNISHLNYYMRMAYKKFLIKYYVLGNVSQLCFPKQPNGGNNDSRCQNSQVTGPSAYPWINPTQGSGGSSKFPSVPAVCISLSSASNPCQLASAVHVVAPPPCNPQDPACGSLQAAAQQIGQFQLDACDNSSIINQKILGLWLYSTDFDANDAGVTQLKGLVNNNDIGLLTEEQMTIERIRNLKNVINSPAQIGVTQARSQALAQNGVGGDTTKAERTVLAFQTILNGLNPTVFDHDSVTMDELLPNSNLLALNELQIPDMKAMSAIMSKVMDPTNPSCTMATIAFKANPYVGVSKDKHSLVYYAIKVTAHANLLFNPFPIGNPADNIEMTAYAAAMPFGSRIGPDLSDPNKLEAEFVNTKGVAYDGLGATSDPEVHYPSMKIDYEGHTTESADYLAALYGSMQGITNGGVAQGQIGASNMAMLMHLAMLPTIAEIGRYNIPVDSERYANDQGQHYFLPYYSLPGGTPNNVGYTFWAPYVGINAFNQFSDDMKQMIENLASLAEGAGGQTTSLQARQAIQQQANAGLGQLEQTLSDPSRTDLEGANTFRMPDPLSQAFWPNGAPPPIPGTVQSADPKVIGPTLATSYVTEHDAQYFKAGRDGYSVKLVPFKILLSNPGTVTNDGGTATWQPVSGNFQSSMSDLTTLSH